MSVSPTSSGDIVLVNLSFTSSGSYVVNGVTSDGAVVLITSQEYSLALVDNLTINPINICCPAIYLHELYSISDRYIVNPIKRCADTINVVGTYFSKPYKYLSEKISVIDSNIKNISKNIKDVLTVLDSTIAKICRCVINKLNIVDSVNYKKVIWEQLFESFGLTDSVKRDILKDIPEVATIVDRTIKRSNMYLQDILSIKDRLETNNIFYLLFKEELDISDSTLSKIYKVIIVSFQLIDNVLKDIFKIYLSTLSKKAKDISTKTKDIFMSTISRWIR